MGYNLNWQSSKYDIYLQQNADKNSKNTDLLKNFKMDKSLSVKQNLWHQLALPHADLVSGQLVHRHKEDDVRNTHELQAHKTHQCTRRERG